ncbi:TonB-dependent siderophore receptor [Sphingomonas sp. 2R-10]|uniref:TonB-dependent siderophore receptor n=1 Tax=Sphingomonas sp. 2R-10 TaxID=3045148 RepID=UPI0019D093D7|nr:TonB-dependent siderophore receptor [Sphingomonas sp. 2R-10]MDJ0277099.1 TonB-dependent siderophore receptor [Sphingomonas sp. 2R-10]
MAALLAMLLPVLPAAAEPVTTADDDTQREDGIVVVGKSYGQAVGKTVTPLKDVPNTITVIDQEQLQQRNLFTLEDALTVTNGVTVTGISSEDPSFLSRGFTINNYLVDGVPTFAFGFPAVVPDLFLYDRVEVLRGPAGLFSGAGNPAGSINLVRKRPLAERSVSALAGYGSYRNLRAELDVSTPLDDRSGVRLGAMVQDQDQFFDVAHRYRFAAFGVADTKIGDDTTLTVGGNYDLFKPAIQSGLPGIIGGTDGSEGQLLDVDRATYLGADWNRFRSESWSGFVELAHRVSDRWTLRATGMVTDVDRTDVYSYIGNQPVTPTNGVTSHIAFRGDSAMQTRSFDFNGVGSFPAFGREQTLIVGADYQASRSTSANARRSNYATINVFAPVSPAEPDLDPYALAAGKVVGGSLTDVEQYGLYGQLRLSPFAGLTLVGGGRMTWWDTTITLTSAQLVRGTPSTYSFDERFTPYAGVVWDVTDDLNLYASYADSFTPQAPVGGRVRPDGRALDPLIGEQYEAGSKLSLMDKRLLLSAAVYQITQNNRVFNDPNLDTIVYQIGKVRARGVEAEASGEILPGWRVNGGYTFTRTKYLEEANPVLEGLSLLPVIPEHMVKLFTNYEPTDGPLAGASVGAGVTWFDATWSGNPAAFNANGTIRTRSTIVRQGAYAVADLRAGYKLTDALSVAVNVNNLFDRNYFARISSTGRGNYYGSPRTVFATIRATFP